MKDRKYVVSRDDVYVGEVVRAFNIYRDLGEVDIFEAKSGKLDTGSWFSYRSMLFVPDENNFSNDLLYKTPNYPILNVTDDNVCLGLGKNSIVIRDACNLAELLEYFDYGKDLTFEDIMKIRKTFFTGKFAKDNCQLFGWRETMAEDLVFYLKGKELTDAWEIEKRRRKFRRKQKAGYREFFGVSESPLSSEYFDVLDERGDNSLIDVFKFYENRINAFAPHIQEGPVKKLTKF